MAIIGSSQYTIVDVGDGLDGKELVAIRVSNKYSRTTLKNWSNNQSTVSLTVVGSMPSTVVVGALVQAAIVISDENKEALLIGTVVNVTNTTVRISIIGFIEPGMDGKAGTDGKDGVGIVRSDTYYIRTPNTTAPSFNATSNLLPDEGLSKSNVYLRNGSSHTSAQRSDAFILRSYGVGYVVTKKPHMSNVPWGGVDRIAYRTNTTSGNKDIGILYPLTAGVTYTLYFWARLVPGTTGTNPNLLLRVFGTRNYLSSGTIDSENWKLYSYSFTPDYSGNASMQFGYGGVNTRVAEFAKPSLVQGGVTDGWVYNAAPPSDASRPYLWMYRRDWYTDGSYKEVGPVLQASGGATVTSIVNHYLISNSLTGITTTTSGWRTTSIAPTASQKYLWMYQRTIMSDGREIVSTPYVAGAYGGTGYTWVRYADSATGEGMSSNPNGKRFLGLAWNKDVETPSSNPSDYSWSPMFNSPAIGGRNLFVPTNIAIHHSPINLVNNPETGYISWTVPTTKNENGWGHGVSFAYDKNNEIIAYNNETTTIGFDVKVSQEAQLRFDVNNMVRRHGGSKINTGTNDNDIISARTGFATSEPQTIPAGKWYRVYGSFKAKDSGYDELVDDTSKLGFLPQSTPYTVEIRNIMWEISETPSAYVPNVVYLQNLLQDKASADEVKKLADSMTQVDTLAREMEAAFERLNAIEAEWLTNLKNVQEASEVSMRHLQESLERMNKREIAELKKYFDGRVDWDFINNAFSVSEDGVRFGTKDGSSSILISNNSIGFFNGSKSPALTMTDSIIRANSGIFNENNRVGHYVEEPLAPTGPNSHINVIRYIP